jgi:hypothetical protein
MTANNTASHIDLPAIDLSDIEDMPGFSSPPAGLYIVNLTVLAKDVKNVGPALEFNYELAEALQIGTDEAERPAKVGQKWSDLHALDSDGLKYAKPKLSFLGQLNGVTTLPDIVAASQGLQVTVQVKYGAPAESKKEPGTFVRYARNTFVA